MWPVPTDKEAFLQQGLLSPETVSPTSDLRDHGAMGRRAVPNRCKLWANFLDHTKCEGANAKVPPMRRVPSHFPTSTFVQVLA